MIRKEIISASETANFYSIAIDCTQEINKQEQAARIIRFVPAEEAAEVGEGSA